MSGPWALRAGARPAMFALPPCFPGGQGVRTDPKSEGFEENYRAAIDRGHPKDEQLGQRWCTTIRTALLIRDPAQGPQRVTQIALAQNA